MKNREKLMRTNLFDNLVAMEKRVQSKCENDDNWIRYCIIDCLSDDTISKLYCDIPIEQGYKSNCEMCIAHWLEMESR